MEKKGLRKMDILRMDGLLPPTRRLPVCDAVPNASDKKKDKKWSLGGILRRISSIKDDSSSNDDEEIVYCEKTPRKPAKFRHDGIVLRSLTKNSGTDKRMKVENNVHHVMDSPCRDSLHSRSSDGSLDGLGKKSRKYKLKARAEAKRDRLRAGSSSDEDCQRSNSSLNKFQVDGTQNCQRNGVCNNRRTRAARTERYIKRLSRDEGNGSGDTLNDSYNKRCSSDYIEDKEYVVYADTNGLCRPPIHPRRAAVYSNSRVFPVEKYSAVSLQGIERATNSPYNENFADVRRYSTGHYITDSNENAYGKITRHLSDDLHADGHRTGNFFTYPAKNVYRCTEPFEYTDRPSIDPDRPPEPPPRDPRNRAYGHGSYPINGQRRNVSNYSSKRNEISRPNWKNFGSYESNNEIAWREMENSTSDPKTEYRNSLERVNNRYNSRHHRANELASKETETETTTTTTRRKNIRNDQLNRHDTNYRANKSANFCETSEHRETISSTSDWSYEKSPCDRNVSPTYNIVDHEESKKENVDRETSEERRRSSRNLEEALFELEAIYNSLRLGDEDLLDRAERRSMEEFNRKRGKNDAIVITPDSPDRTKDDMAYRRMHPKERPTSLLDVAGQSTLSSISYLIASPVLSRRRDSAENLASYPSRRDEPDVTRDDVLFRSINHANNTLRVIDPQPPFGIPLGPVTGATESDYLHTAPTKSDQPRRSPYIPQREPDVVTDDLAYRTLRKDAVAARTVENKIDKVQSEPVAHNGMRKKRAVRSLSANLYGLINRDRIYTRREPSEDEIQDVGRNLAATAERPRYLRRVASDGELSDNEAYRWKESAVEGGIDINGNHPAIGAYGKKLYVSPETTAIAQSPKKEKESGVAKLSDASLSSKAISNDEFWHEYLHSDSNVVPAADSGHSPETDFTAYSRLCQDLVDLIKSDDDAPIERPRADDKCDFEVDETQARYDRIQIIRSLDRRCSESPCANNVARSVESESPADNLDFYLRVADENVKLIAEAFGTVVDSLRDCRLSARRISSASRGSEIEDQSGSTPSSSAPYGRDESTSDDPRISPRFGRLASKRHSLTSNEGDQGDDDTDHLEDDATADAELSRAVRDLQLAAASLYEHEPEIESLSTRRGRLVCNVSDANDSEDEDEDDRVQERERDQEEAVVVPSGVEARGRESREGLQALARPPQSRSLSEIGARDRDDRRRVMHGGC